MANCKWKKIDVNTIQHPPVWLAVDDFCCYAREYTIGGGYKASETNQLILNLKKPVSQKGLPGWHYKAEAIDRFARELAALISNTYTVAHIPPSKPKNHPDYDPRLEDTLKSLKRYNNKISIECPMIRSGLELPKHAGGTRNPHIDKSTLEWVGFNNDQNLIILIDDVITSGASFKACQQLIFENSPHTTVVGVFWARAIQAEGEI